jgi:hypothetical protein
MRQNFHAVLSGAANKAAYIQYTAVEYIRKRWNSIPYASSEAPIWNIFPACVVV